MKKLVISIILSVAALSLSAQKNYIFLVNKAAQFEKNKKFEQAAKLLDSAAILHDYDNYLFYKAGIDFFKAKDWNNAQKAFSHSNQFCLWKAKIFALKNNPDSATACLANYLKQKNKIPQYKIIQDTAFAHISRSPQWKNLWQKNWYDTTAFYLDKIEFLTNLDQNLQACDMLEKLVKKQPQNLRAQILLLKNLIKLHRYNQAIKLIDKIFNRYPDKYFLLTTSAKIYTALHKYDQALAQLQLAYQLRPYNLNLLSQMADLAIRTNNPKQAEKFMKTLIYYQPSDSAYYHLAKIYYINNQLLDAIKILNKLLTHTQANYHYFTLRGKAFYKTGNMSQAFYDLTMSLDIYPYQPELYDLIGDAAFAIGHKQEACLYWQQAYQMFHNPNSYKKLKNLCQKIK